MCLNYKLPYWKFSEDTNIWAVNIVKDVFHLTAVAHSTWHLWFFLFFLWGIRFGISCSWKKVSWLTYSDNIVLWVLWWFPPLICGTMYGTVFASMEMPPTSDSFSFFLPFAPTHELGTDIYSSSFGGAVGPFSKEQKNYALKFWIAEPYRSNLTFKPFKCKLMVTGQGGQ